MEKTEWYPIYIQPIRDGVYEISYIENLVSYAKYETRRWYFAHINPGLAADVNALMPLQIVTFKWRGLSRDPSGKILSPYVTSKFLQSGVAGFLMTDFSVRDLRVRDIKPEDWVDGVDGSYSDARRWLAEHSVERRRRRPNLTSIWRASSRTA